MTLLYELRKRVICRFRCYNIYYLIKEVFYNLENFGINDFIGIEDINNQIVMIKNYVYINVRVVVLIKTELSKNFRNTFENIMGLYRNGYQ